MVRTPGSNERRDPMKYPTVNKDLKNDVGIGKTRFSIKAMDWGHMLSRGDYS